MIDNCPYCNRITAQGIVKTKRGDINVYCCECYGRIRKANDNDKKLFRKRKFINVKED